MDIEIDPQAETVIFRSEGKADHHYRRGDIIGESYQLIDLIGKGGMGVVYRVKHLILGQQYALKLLAPDQVNSQSWRRFEIEGRSLAKLNHENIVSIYNMGVDKGCPYFVMDWLSGISLAEHIDESGPLSERETLDIFLQVCAGLGCAHKNGIIHRDIKPANIMLIQGKTGIQAKIVDFGIARLQSTEANVLQALTKSGEVFGSPLYMSPEQSRGEEIDARSDLYSLGCSLFETLAGQAPFRGPSAIATLMMHQEDEPPKLSSVSSNNSFDPSFDLLLARCLCKNTKQRYQSADQLAVDLQRILDGKPIGPSHVKAIEAIGKSEKQTGQKQTAKKTESHADQSERSTLAVDDNETDHNESASSMRLASSAVAQVAAAVALLLLLGAFGALIPRMWKKETKQIASHTLRPLPSELNSQVYDQLGNAISSKQGERLKLLAKDATIGATSKTPESILGNSTAIANALQKVQNISQGVRTIDGKEVHCFQFPTTASVGSIWTSTDEKTAAQGLVKLDPKQNVILRFGPIIGCHPPLVDTIAADDIYELRLDNLKSIGEVTKRLKGWTKLHMLTINSGSMSDTDLKSLDAIQNLNNLWMKNLAFNPKTFASLQVLQRLDRLEIEDCKQINEILTSLPIMPKLTFLTLENNNNSNNKLQGTAIASLAKHPRLKSLQFKFRTKKSAPEEEDWTDSPSSSDNLPGSLYIYDLRFDLAKLTNVDQINLEKPNWSNQQIKEFLRVVPAARKNQWATKFSY